MQIHPGSHPNHNRQLHEEYGPDKGSDIPRAVDFVSSLKPLLDRFGNEARLTVILFTLDETTYSRELRAARGATIRCSSSVPPGGSMTARRASCVFASDDRDGRFLQHGRLQRRYARLPVDSCASRRRPPRRLLLSRAARRRAPPGRGRGADRRGRPCLSPAEAAPIASDGRLLE